MSDYPQPTPNSNFNRNPDPNFIPNNNLNNTGGTNAEDQKLIGIVAHLGGVLFSWIVPLIVFLVFPADRNPWLNRHAKEALNFQIALFIGYLISGVLTVVLIGFVMMFALWVYSIVVSIQAAMAASRGEDYLYPLSVRLIK